MELKALRSRIPELAAGKGMSIRELARRVNIKPSTMASYTSMRSPDIPLRIAILIAEEFEVLPEELYAWNRKVLR